MADALWTPTADGTQGGAMAEFIETVEEDWNVTLGNSRDLWRFSVDQPARFWTSLKDWAGIAAETWGDEALVDGDRMPGARWFPGARLNFAQNLLQRRNGGDAIVFWSEDKVRRRISWADLYDGVSRLVQALEAEGVGPGDRVAGYLPNMPEAIMAMLASSALGAIWSSCSLDFGVRGVLDRFGQIKPKVLFAADGYHFKGRTYDCLDKVRQISAALPTLGRTVVIPHTRTKPAIEAIRNATLLTDFIDSHLPGEIPFRQLPFDHPLCILFSSGTTGVPKCIVHGAGGPLLQHVKEHRLHCDIRPDDRVFYFTTCGWMMWNWLASVLASQATVLLYDGSPFHPRPGVLFDLAEEEGMTLFGTSAKYLDALHKSGFAPRQTHDLSRLRTMASTGSPLAAETFDYVYGGIKEDLHLASISGGTDIVSCFVLGDPTRPVHRGEIQGPGLGMAIDVFGTDGKPLRPGKKGELVCTRPFPSMPIGFWDDPDGARYRAAYFERFPGVWHHGDFIEWTDAGGFVIHGRSDTTLNPGGVRIGTAEIYRQVESFDEIAESIVVGQDFQGDQRIVLFVVLTDGTPLDETLKEKIRVLIRNACTPRHVPAKIIAVGAIPRTRSGKITELAVRDVLHGRDVKNIEALANPEALDLYRNLPELRG